MYVLIANGVFGLVVMGVLLATKALHWGWAIVLGVVAFAVGQGLVGYLLQRKVKGAMEEVQRIRRAVLEGDLWELVERRCRAHPALLSALRRLGN